MVEKKLSQKEIVNQSIELLKRVDSITELENILDIKITEEILESIQKELKRKKKQIRNSKRKNASRGDRGLVFDQKNLIREANLLYEKFVQIKKTSTTPENNIESIKEKLIRRIEEEGYWLDNKMQEQFNIYQESIVHGDRIDILRKLAYKYLEDVQELLEIKIATIEDMKKMEVENKDTARKHIIPWLKSSPPTKEEYLPYEEKVKEIIKRINRSKNMILILQELEEIESKELSCLDSLEITTEELVESQDFIIPTNETERKYQEFLQCISQRQYNISDLKSQLSFSKELKVLLEEMASLPRFKLDEMITLAKNVIAQKRKQIKRKDLSYNEKEKQFLKHLEQKFEDIRPVVDVEESDTKPYFDILQKLLNDDRNYEYIKQLLAIEGFQKARTIVRTKEGKGRNVVRRTEKKHITLYILDCFIKNYKLKLSNQKKDYIEPTYYKEILKLFINRQIELNPNEIIEYNKRIEEFSKYIKEKSYQNTNQVLNDINEISYINGIKQRNPQSIIIDCDYENKIDAGVEENRNLKSPEYMPNEMITTFKLEGLETYGFSIEYLMDGSRKLGVHILDLPRIIDINEKSITEIDYENIPNLNIGRIYPTYCFETGIGIDNKLYHGYMHPTNILIEKSFSKSEQEQYRDYPELKELSNWLGLLQIEQVTENNEAYEDDSQKLISNYLAKKISERLEKEEVILINNITLPNQEELIEKNHMDTCGILSKVPREIAHQIFDILDDKEINKYYSATKASESKVAPNPKTIEGVYLLEVLHRIQEKNYSIDTGTEEVNTILEKANEKHQYIPSCLKKHNDSKTRQTDKIYRK